MADLNREALEAVAARQNDGAVSVRLTPGDPGPPFAILHEQRAALKNIPDPTAVIGQFNPDRISIRQMELMRRDPMIRLGLHFRKVPLIRAPWRVDSDDAQVASFIDGAMRPIWHSLLGQMLGSLDFGYAPIVKRFGLAKPDWKYEDPADRKNKDVWPDNGLLAIVPKDPQPLPPRGAKPLFTADGNSFDGIEHSHFGRTRNSPTPLRVDVAHSLWVTNERDESFGDWFGYPATGYAFRYWWSYWYYWLLGDRHFEQDADPPLVVDYPPGTTPDPRDPDREIANVDLAITAGTEIRAGSTVALSSEVYVDDSTGKPTGHRKWDARFLRGGENMRAFHDSFEYMDVLKLRSVLVPEQALVEGLKGTGSRNVAEVFGSALVESQAITLANLIRHVNEHYVTPLVEQNFLSAPKTRIVTEGLRAEDAEMIREALKIALSNDPKAVPIDLRRLGTQAGLPMLTPEQQKEAEEEALERAIRQAKAFEQFGGNPAGGQGARDQNGPPGESQGGSRKQADARDAGRPSPSGRKNRPPT